MVPIKQKNIHDKAKGTVGDCFRACICSILEISDEGMPNFAEDETWTTLREWLNGNKLDIYYYDFPKDITNEYYMAVGVSPRGVLHSVVYKDGKLAHDPHPDGGGIKEVKYYMEIDNDDIS